MSVLPEDLRRLLDYFEFRIDTGHVERVTARHRAYLSGEALSRPPLVCYVPYEGSGFRPYPVREILDDPAKMLVNELLSGFTSLFHAIDRGDDTPYVIRANLGTGILASMFGAAIEVLEDNPPWARPLNGPQAIERVVDAPLPEITAGLGRQMFAHYSFFRDVLTEYPRCAGAFCITLPDLQSPFDTAEMLWGSDIYVSLRKRPELLRELLDKVAQQMLRVRAALDSYINDPLLPLGNFQHATSVKGRLLIRNDSIVLVSPKMYRDVVSVFDARLAAELGIAIHFCGDGAHQIDNLLSIANVQGLDFGQSNMMDIDAVYAKTSSAGVPIARVQPPRDELTNGEAAQRFPRLASFCYIAESVADAADVCAAYYANAQAAR